MVLFAATFVYLSWTLSGLVLTINTAFRLPIRLGAIRWCFHEFKPLYPIAYVVVYGPDVVTGHVEAWTVAGMFFGIMNWFTFKDIDDDDRWKRRRRKVVERVRALGGRLTVVADGAR